VSDNEEWKNQLDIYSSIDNDYIIEFTSSVFRRDSVGSITWDDILNVIAFGKSWT